MACRTALGECKGALSIITNSPEATFNRSHSFAFT